MDPSIFKAIHWQQIIIYFLGFWLFSHSFQVLASLFDLELSEVVRLSHDPRQEMVDRNYDVSRLNHLRLYMALGRMAGLIIGFWFAIELARSRRGNWINPTIAFLIAFLMGIFNLMGWSFVKNVFLSPGSITNGVWYYLINGIILMLLGGGIIYGFHVSRKRKISKNERMDFA